MKIDEAVEILKLSKDCLFEGDAVDLEAAVQLGIEALKRIREYHHIDNTYQLLPGETKAI